MDLSVDMLELVLIIILPSIRLRSIQKKENINNHLPLPVMENHRMKTLVGILVRKVV